MAACLKISLALTNLFKDGLTDKQYYNSVKEIIRTISTNGIEELVASLPSSISEKKLAEKLLLRIIKSSIDVKKTERHLRDFYYFFDEDTWADLTAKILEKSCVEQIKILLNHIPSTHLKNKQISQIIDKVVAESLDSPVLIETYVQRCKVNPSILIDFIDNLQYLSRGRIAARYLANKHMDVAAPFLTKFLSGRISESSKHIGFEAVIYLDKIEDFSNEILDYSLQIESKHFDYFLQSVSGLTGDIEFTDKFEITFKTLADRITKMVKNADNPKKVETAYRRVTPELRRYEFLESVCNQCVFTKSPEFENSHSFNDLVTKILMPKLALSNSFYLIERNIHKFDNETILKMLKKHSHLNGLDTDIVKILKKSGKGFVERIFQISYDKLLSEASKENRDELRDLVLDLCRERIHDAEFRLNYLKKVLNHESVTVEMLIESDEHVNESNLKDRFHRTEALYELDFEKAVRVVRSGAKISQEMLMQMFEDVEDEVTKYGLLLAMLPLSFRSDPVAFWEKLGELEPSVMFCSKVGFSGEEEKKFRGLNFFSTFKRLLPEVITPLLSKEIVVDDKIYNSVINTIKSDNGSYFEFERFKQEDIQKIYSSLVLENKNKSEKEFGRWFVSRNKYGLDILINNASEGNYHLTEHLIGLDFEYRMYSAMEELISSSDINIDCAKFNKKLISRINSKSPNYYNALEWMIALPSTESFDFIDGLCEEKDDVRYFSFGGIYSGEVVISYRKCINLVQTYLKKFTKDLKWKHLKIGDIESFVEHFSKYDPDKIGRIY
jgi:hypothetical protein